MGYLGHTIMTYIISRKGTNGETLYLQEGFPCCKWIEYEECALRMRPVSCSRVSLYLMRAGISHTITQKNK